MFSASKTAAPASNAYQISNSVRFRSAASAYFSRMPSVAGNRQTWTWSGWVKRGTLGASQVLFDCDGGATDTTFGEFGFNGSDAFEFIAYNLAWRVTSQVFRDPSAWYHLVVVFDTTQATAANRVKIYVNGYQITAFSTSNDPAQNTSYAINQAAAHNIAKVFGGRGYFDGYLADINFIDGQALTPSSFGQINPTTGVWQPIKYAGTYGTNGFHLAFNNGTSTTTLGYDTSGNGNNWTPNNISLTAGSTYDWMLDSPTPFAGTSYGVGNYAVLNPLSNLYGSTLSNANLTAYCSTIQSGASGTVRLNSGSWYFEETIQATGSPGRNWVGFMDDSYVADNNGFSYTSKTLLYASDGSGGITGGAYGASYTTGDVIGVAFNIDTGTIAFYKNGVSQGNLTTGASGVNWRPFVSFGATGWQGAMNFGQRPFAYTPPSGYKTLCTQNLPSPTIKNGAAHFAATLYTGTGASQSITNTVNGVSLTPDLTWIKSRSAATDHKLTDIVRGVTKGLISDSAAAETTDTNGLTAFNSNGFTIGSDTVYNNNAATYVAWQWKAGGTAVTNTAGSITSQVSANTTAGFSVVTYTGAISGTVGHGLGVAPSLIICKSRTAAVDWPVYHVSLGKDYALLLSTTNAAGMYSNYWGTSSPNASVFGLWSSLGSNNNGSMVAYCFAAIAGYSAFGSYTGNGSTDGVFVYCGFQPRFVLIKCSSTTGNWYIFDSARNTYNVLGEQLYPNLSNAGSTVTTLDILSNGFKMRISTDPNASATYIYAAFASSPFNSSLAF